MSPVLHRAGRRAGLAVVAVADQGLFAVAGFAVSIMAGRSLSTADVGRFAVLQACAMLIATLHSAALLEPGVVLISSDRASAASQLRRLVLWHLKALGVVAAVGVGAAGLGPVGVASAFSVTLVAAGISSVLLVRRLAYSVGRRWLGAVTSSGCSALVLAGLIAWPRHGGPHWFQLLYGGTGVVVAAVAGGVLLRSGPARRPGRPDGQPDRDDVVQRHWNYARWSVASSLVYWAQTTSLPIVVTVLAGPTAAGVFARGAVLVNPLGQLLAAVSLFALPALALRRERTRFTRTVDFASAILGAGVAVVAVPLLVAPQALLSLAYAGAGSASVGVVQVLALAGVLDALKQGWVLGLSAVERSQSVFLARLVTLAAIAVPLPMLLVALGPRGAAWSLAIGNGLTGASARYQLRRWVSA